MVSRNDTTKKNIVVPKKSLTVNVLLNNADLFLITGPEK